MKAIVQYPDILQAASIPAESIQDADGNWVTPDSSLITQKCRAEANTKGQQIATADGSLISFDWLIYLPYSTIEVETGSRVTISRGGQGIAAGNVKRFFRGQLNARVWL